MYFIIENINSYIYITGIELSNDGQCSVDII